MKINKSLIKEAILAFALTSLICSSANAADYYVGDNSAISIDYTIDSNGTLYFGNYCHIDMDYTQLGNSSGGRFTIISEDPSPNWNGMNLEFTSLYLNGFSAKNFLIEINNNSSVYSDGALNLGYLGVSHSSTLKAASITADEIRIYQSYAEFTAVNVGSIYVQENSTWVATGISTVEYLNMNPLGTVELRMSSAADAIYVSDTIFIGNNVGTFKYSFTEDFTDSIFAGDGFFDFIFSETIVGNIVRAPMDTLAIYVANSNDKYTWDVTYIGDKYRISNFELIAIPEPSTYAAIFGLIALAFVAYRRRS